MTPTRLGLAVSLTASLPLTLPAQRKSERKKVAQEASKDQNRAEPSKALARWIEVDTKAATSKYANAVQPAIYNVAWAYAIRKDEDLAFQRLNKAVDAGDVLRRQEPAGSAGARLRLDINIPLTMSGTEIAARLPVTNPASSYRDPPGTPAALGLGAALAKRRRIRSTIACSRDPGHVVFVSSRWVSTPCREIE